MAYLRNKNAVFLFKIESSEGTDAAPDAANDAILIENPSIRLSPQLESTNEVGGSLDGFGDLVGGLQVSMSFSVMLKGSGAAASAPEWGPLMKACGYAETITGTAVPSSAEACASGGSTTTAKLGASASSTADTYNGMPINFTSGVTGNSFIADYDSSKIATLTDLFGSSIGTGVNYQIPVNVLYTPASDSIPSGTGYLYLDGIVYKFLGMRGSVDVRIPTGKPGRLTFNLSGMFSEKADASVPASPTNDSTRPPLFKNAKFYIDRVAAAIAEFSFGSGNNIVFPENPNVLEGFDAPQITARKITGQIDPAETLVASRDLLTAMRAGTTGQIHLRYGASAGNRIGVTVPRALYTGQDPADRGGLATLSVPFQAIGQDSGLHLCIY